MKYRLKITDEENKKEINVSEDEIMGVNIPTAVPLVYEFDNDFKVLKHYYLANEEELNAKMNAVANQGKAK